MLTKKSQNSRPYTCAYLESKTLLEISNLPNVASFFTSSVVFAAQPHAVLSGEM